MNTGKEEDRNDCGKKKPWKMRIKSGIRKNLVDLITCQDNTDFKCVIGGHGEYTELIKGESGTRE